MGPHSGSGHCKSSSFSAATTTTTTSSSMKRKDIYYFAYGVVCHDLVRERRGIQVKSIEAAYLPDYRLTFAFGGNANIVAKKGYEVHGLLMKLSSEEDWKKLLDFEAGNKPTIRRVVPYRAEKSLMLTDATWGKCGEDDEGAGAGANLRDVEADENGAIETFVIEMPENVDDTLLDAPIEQIPQERYLKLISQGMGKYGVDMDYVQDQIMSVPFTPTRKIEEYQKFPDAKKVTRISWRRYEKLCARGVVEGDHYFVFGQDVYRIGEHDPENPLAKWFEEHGHGKADCTYMVYLTVVEPDLPVIRSAEDVTDLHRAWAENHIVDVIQKYGMSATRVHILCKEEEKEDCSTDDESSGDLVVSCRCPLFFRRFYRRRRH